MSMKANEMWKTAMNPFRKRAKCTFPLLSSFHETRLITSSCLGVYTCCTVYLSGAWPPSVWAPEAILRCGLLYLFPFSNWTTNPLLANLILRFFFSILLSIRLLSSPSRKPENVYQTCSQDVHQNSFMISSYNLQVFSSSCYKQNPFNSTGFVKYSWLKIIIINVRSIQGTRGSVVRWGSVLKPEGRGFDSRRGHWISQLT
jgi:hypothetical protein